MGDGAQCDAFTEKLITTSNRIEIIIPVLQRNRTPGGAHTAGAKSEWFIRTMRMSPHESVRDLIPIFGGSPTVSGVFSRPGIPLYSSADPGVHKKPVTGIIPVTGLVTRNFGSPKIDPENRGSFHLLGILVDPSRDRPSKRFH